MAKFMANVAALTRREILVDKNICAVIGIITFALLTGFGAYVRLPLPFTPVPLTLQTMFVLLGGAVLGGRKGMCSQVLAIVLGMTGITTFAAGRGLLVFWGPTGGYLLGFVLAAGLVGFLHKLNEKRSFLFTLWAMSLGDLILLICGMIRLSVFVGGIQNAFMLGVAPFIIGDMIKIFAAALIYMPLANRSREIFFQNS